MTADPAELDPGPSVRCVCGKQGWPDKADAELVVVNAKIRRWLHGKRRRREQAVYRCPQPPWLFHTTSHPH